MSTLRGALHYGMAFFDNTWLRWGEHVPKLHFILRPTGSRDCPLHSESQGSAKVVAAPQLGQVAALLPAIHCSAKKGFAGAPF